MKLAVVILAAGLGTRMKSSRAKVLHELAGKELVRYPVELGLSLKADPVVVVVGHQAHRVREVLKRHFDASVKTALQKEQLGTGHAVLSAKNALKGFKGYVLILSGDVPLLERRTIRRLIQTTARRRSPLGIISAKLADPTGYGRVVREAEGGRVLRVVEQRDATREELAILESNMGIYLADAEFLFKQLRRIGTDNDQGEYYLPDLIELAVADGRQVVTVEASEEETCGINHRKQLAEMEQIMRTRIAERLMLSGVTLLDPATTFIDADVRIKPDTVIGPGCHIRGRVRVGTDCRIDAGCVIEDSVLGDGVHVKPYTVIERSRVDDEAILGPFSHLRPMSHIGRECHVGNFVETKKTRLMPGAKANHLSYLGDAVIGRATNIGAGTITCNYDGYNKYKTRIGDEVLIGSDTQLIAPVSVPDRAVLGAGTSLTGKDKLPKGALFITRPEAVVVEGYRDRLEARSGKKKARPVKSTSKKSKKG